MCVAGILIQFRTDQGEWYLQIMQQFPDVFEFNENLLCVVLDHLYSCLFGTFLCNNDKERWEMKLTKETQSLWSFVNSKQRSLFLNQMYSKPVGSKVAIFPIASIRSSLHIFNKKCLLFQIRMVHFLYLQVYAVLERLPLPLES